MLSRKALADLEACGGWVLFGSELYFQEALKFLDTIWKNPGSAKAMQFKVFLSGFKDGLKSW